MSTHSLPFPNPGSSSQLPREADSLSGNASPAADVVANDELRRAFFALETPADVAALLQVSLATLSFLLYAKPHAARYTAFHVAKRSGGTREILVPAPALKTLQHRLHAVLRTVYTPKAPVHGFAAGRSVVTNAARHVGQRFVLNVDLRDFFPSINFGRVRGLLMAVPYGRNDKVATVLAQLCCHGTPAVLPQGAPTSPIVANMLCAKMDSHLRRLAEALKCHYTRYADDLTFSTSHAQFPRELAHVRGSQTHVGHRLRRVLAENGFEVNSAKVRLRGRTERQEVTGLTTNQFVNVERRYIRQVRAMLHAWDRYGYDAAEREHTAQFAGRKHRRSDDPSPFHAVLAGKLEYLGMVKGRVDPVYARLVQRARALDPERFCRVALPEDAVWVLRDLTTYDPQGTAFLLDGVGWVSCAHTCCPGMVLHRPDAGSPVYDARIRRASERYDIAVLDSDAPRPRGLPVASSSFVLPGEPVTVLGFPQWGYGQSVQATDTTVTGTTPIFLASHVCVAAIILPGNSGGPVLNRRGEVIGIAAKGSYTRTNQSVVVPIDLVLRLLAQPIGTEEELWGAPRAERAPVGEDARV